MVASEARRLCRTSLSQATSNWPYIADFVCLRARLVVELDGATHSSDNEIAYDGQREDFLRRCGFHVLRFWNAEVYENLDSVVDTIWHSLRR